MNNGGIRNWINSHKLLTVVALIFFTGLIQTFFSPDTSSTSQQVDSTSSRPIAEAEAEFKDLMETGGKAGLIASWEFSETANVVYVTDVWYGQSATFKKDFLAKVAMLRKETQGYRWFEVRDSTSNEKVAEVTSFSGSLEVYK